MAISEQDKRAIDQAVEGLYFVSTDVEGRKSIDPFYVDYRDTNEFLLQDAYDKRKAAYENPDMYGPENELIYTLQDKISEAFLEQRWDIEDEIVRKAGFDPSDDKAAQQIEYLRDTYSFEPPFDHFLEQDILVNILLAVDGESNSDFVLIHEQYETMTGRLSPKDAKESLSQESGLSLLVNQQGYTMEQLETAMQIYNGVFNADEPNEHVLDEDGQPLSLSERVALFRETENPFLTSVCQELENMTNYMNCMTVLAKMDMYDFAEMMKPGKEITFPKEAKIGVFCPWSGGGNVLDIELEKDLVIPSEMIWDAQIEGTEMDAGQYSLDSVYGLLSKCWQNIKSIKDAVPEKKPSLNSIIGSAQQKAHLSAGMNGIGREAGR